MDPLPWNKEIDNKKIEKFESKWQSTKLRHDEELNRKVAKSYLKTLESLKKSWEEFNENLEKLKRDLDHFGIESSELELAEVQPGEVEVFDLLPAEALADEEVLGRPLLHHAEADGVACRLFLGNEKFVGY